MTRVLAVVIALAGAAPCQVCVPVGGEGPSVTIAGAHAHDHDDAHGCGHGLGTGGGCAGRHGGLTGHGHGEPGVPCCDHVEIARQTAPSATGLPAPLPAGRADAGLDVVRAWPASASERTPDPAPPPRDPVVQLR